MNAREIKNIYMAMWNNSHAICEQKDDTNCINENIHIMQ